MRRSVTTLTLCVLALLMSALTAQAQQKTSEATVLKFTINDLVLNQYDAQVILYFTDGQIHHGYTLVPERDNLPHRVDVTPSSPYIWVDIDGNKIEIPDKMRGRYSYKQKALFGKYQGMYAKGEIDVKHTPSLSPLKVTDKKLSGYVDVLILGLDEANSAGRSNSALVYRLKVEAKKDNGQYMGKATTWQYKDGDEYYGKDNPRREVNISAEWITDHWKAKPGTEYAEGSDWPNVHGPYYTMTAKPYDGQLIHNLEDAKLLWVAEDTLTSGRSGGRTRGDFAMFPFAWKTIGYGGYGAPIIADDKVFVFVQMPNEKKIEASEQIKTDVYIKLGIDPRSLSSKIPAHMDTVFCYDARTGKRLWRFDRPINHLGRESKSGLASTPAFHNGVVYARGHGGLYALNANTGELIWRAGFGVHSAPDDASPVIMGDTLIVTNRPGRGENPQSVVFGLDLKTGKEKWKVEGVSGSSKGMPGRYVVDGKEYAIFPRVFAGKYSKKRHADKTFNENFVMVDPSNGKIVWESDALGFFSGQMMVWDDIVIGNYVKEAFKQKNGSKLIRLGGAKLSPKGAKQIWTNPKVNYQAPRTVPVINNGIAYLDSRVTGWQAVDLKTGKTIGRNPHIYHLSQGSHNWTWQISTNDRMITSGLLMFTTADKGFKQLPGRLSLDITSGYRAPTVPAIADGRIVLRLSDKLVCYDLRQRKDTPKYDVVTLKAEDGIVGAAPERDNDIHIRIRVKDGKAKTAAAKIDRIGGKYQWSIINWAGTWASASPWRRTHSYDLELTDSAMKGPVDLRMGWNTEPFEFDLKREGDSFTGTYTRIAPPLKKPFGVTGALQGNIRDTEAGDKVFVLELIQGIPNRNEIISAGPATQNATIAVITRDNKIINAWAACGRLNTVIHEVDPKGLTVEGDTIKGELYIITHDDQHIDVHTDNSFEQRRSAADGSALAIRYTLEAKKAGEKLTGTYDGTVGVEWRHSGKLTGQIQPDVAP